MPRTNVTAERLAKLEVRSEVAETDRKEIKEGVASIRKDTAQLVSSVNRLDATFQGHMAAHQKNGNGRGRQIERGVLAGGGGGLIAALAAIGKGLGWW